MMRILFGNNELSEKQIDCYESIMYLHAFSDGAGLIYKMVEERLGKMNSLTVDIRKALNKEYTKKCNQIEELRSNGGDYTDLIEIV